MSYASCTKVNSTTNWRNPIDKIPKLFNVFLIFHEELIWFYFQSSRLFRFFFVVLLHIFTFLSVLLSFWSISISLLTTFLSVWLLYVVALSIILLALSLLVICCCASSATIHFWSSLIFLQLSHRWAVCVWSIRPAIVIYIHTHTRTTSFSRSKKIWCSLGNIWFMSDII